MSARSVAGILAIMLRRTGAMARALPQDDEAVWDDLLRYMGENYGENGRNWLYERMMQADAMREMLKQYEEADRKVG
jgi:hypothetical protein